MALDTHGNLLVVETGTKSLVRVNVATGEMSTVVTGLAVGAAPHPGHAADVDIRWRGRRSVGRHLRLQLRRERDLPDHRIERRDKAMGSKP